MIDVYRKLQEHLVASRLESVYNLDGSKNYTHARAMADVLRVLLHGYGA